MKQLNLSLLCASFLLSTFALGQTNPAAYDLSIGDFSFTGFADGTSTEYPANTHGWRFASEPGIDFVGEPSDNRDLVNSASNPTSGSIKNEEANGISFLNSGSNGIGALVVALNTMARENIAVSWLAEDIRDGSTRENGIRLQYRIGETGDFTDVENTAYISNPTDFSAAANFDAIALPAEANNQEVVQVRWLYYFSSGGGARDRIRLDEILISSDEMMSSLVPVTFQVDMSNETVDPAGVGISGSFNGFEFEAMDDLGDGLYAITIELQAGSAIEYKFRNGDAFEDVPDACGDGAFNNRTLLVPDAATTLDVVCYATCEACPPPGEMYQLTIRVNASQIFDVDPAGIHVAGNFNGFTPQPMTNIGILNYTITVMVEEGTTVLWKFLNGNSFDGQETVPAECGEPDGFGGFNRAFVMPSEDTVLDNVCFGSCALCGVVVEYEVTMRVDVSQLGEIDPEGIHIGGNFTEFITEPMLDEGNGIYSYSLFAAEGQPLAWKYVNGSTYAGSESVPAACGINDGFGGFNRTFLAPAEDVVLDIVCFSSCTDCSEPGENFNITFQVDASQIDIDPAGIHIAGTFNGFSPAPMTDAGDGIYTFTASAEGGTTVLWKYLNSVNFDGQESVPGACGADDGFGGFNRTLEMPAAETVLDAVCFASCEACSDPGQEFDLVFQVDASQIDIDPAGIHIAGTFNGFSPEPMQDSGDGIYTFSALVTAGTTVLFKYTNGPTFGGVESVPAACGSDDGFGGFNRFFEMPAAPTALDMVCFSSCAACTDPGEEFTLVFQVDASQIDIDPAGIHIGGTFNGFNPEPMQDGGNGIYTFSATVASGTTVLWKYTNGPTFNGAEDVPSACGITDGFGGFNRTFDMPAAPTVLDIVCFSSCEACEDPGVLFDLTFQVDASQIEIDPAGIFIAGSFNGFSPEAMTDAGNGLYTFTTAAAAGSEVLWKYLNGGEFTGAEDVPGECGEDDGFGGFNRSILMPAQNAVLSVVCFSSCAECLIWVNEATLPDAVSVYPNPNSGVFNILSPVAGDAQISIYELSGRLVYNELRYMEADQPTELNTSISESGFYLVEMRIGEHRFITKITVM